MINWRIEEKNKSYGKKVKFFNWYYLDLEEVNKVNDYILNNEVVIYDILETYDDEKRTGMNISKSRIDKESTEGYLYQIKNSITGKLYIGRSINPIARVIDHIRSSSSKELSYDFRKYGFINFTFKCWIDDNYKVNEYVLINSYDKDKLYNKSFS